MKTQTSSSLYFSSVLCFLWHLQKYKWCLRPLEWRRQRKVPCNRKNSQAGPEKKENKDSRKDGANTEVWGGAKLWESSNISWCLRVLVLSFPGPSFFFYEYLSLHFITVFLSPTQSIRGDQAGSQSEQLLPSVQTSRIKMLSSAYHPLPPHWLLEALRLI